MDLKISHGSRTVFGLVILDEMDYGLDLDKDSDPSGPSAVIAYSMRVFKSVISLSLQEIQHNSYPLCNNPYNIDKNKIHLNNIGWIMFH